MSVPVTIDSDIEMAMLAPIWNAMIDAGAPYLQPDGVTPSLQLTNEALNTAPLSLYARWGFFPAMPLVREVGPTPAMTRKGFCRIDTYVRLGLGNDPAKAFTALIRGAYPYATTLPRNGTDVIVDIIEVKGAVEEDAWLMTNVNVYFDVWR